MKSHRLIVIAGPTAVGKTELAVQLAELLKTEIVSADSRQLFNEMTIGTAKPSETQLARVKHHFINSHSIHEAYNAGHFGRDALVVIEQLFQQNSEVILCGGSGLYIDAVCNGFDDMPEVPGVIRNRIAENYKLRGLAWIQKQVAERDPLYFEIVDRNNPQRLMRALELLELNPTSLTLLRQKKQKEHFFDVIKIGLELERNKLYERINSRMDQMIELGLFAEAKNLHPLRHLNALQTVGYQEVFDFFEGLYDRDEAIRLLKRNSRRYAKRQLTWFKRDKKMAWFNAEHLERTLIEVTRHLDRY